MSTLAPTSDIATTNPGVYAATLWHVPERQQYAVLVMADYPVSATGRAVDRAIEHGLPFNEIGRVGLTFLGRLCDPLVGQREIQWRRGLGSDVRGLGCEARRDRQDRFVPNTGRPHSAVPANHCGPRINDSADQSRRRKHDQETAIAEHQRGGGEVSQTRARFSVLQRAARSLRERYAMEITPAELDREIPDAMAQLRRRLEAQGIAAPADDAMLIKRSAQTTPNGMPKR